MVLNFNEPYDTSKSEGYDENLFRSLGPVFDDGDMLSIINDNPNPANVEFAKFALWHSGVQIEEDGVDPDGRQCYRLK